MHPPTPLLISHFHKPNPPNPDRKDERNASRGQLRSCFNGELVRLSGRSDERLRYEVRRYAQDVADGHGYRFNDDGWPSDIPFRDLNRIPGGTPVYRRLLSRWEEGLLRFVKATDEDKRNARLNPWLVFPNAAERAAALGIPRAPSTQLVHHITEFASRFEVPPPSSPPTTGLVLHPSTMLPQFTFSVLPEGGSADSDGASGAPPRERSQRSDINKSRKRPVTNPEGRELRHPKRGPTTTKGVVEADGITADGVEHAIKRQEILLTDENLSDCVEIAGAASGSRSGWEPASSEDEIESTDELEASDWRAVGRPRRLRM